MPCEQAAQRMHHGTAVANRVEKASHEEAEELTKQFCATLRAYAARLDEEDR